MKYDADGLLAVLTRPIGVLSYLANGPLRWTTFGELIFAEPQRGTASQPAESAVGPACSRPGRRLIRRQERPRPMRIRGGALAGPSTRAASGRSSPSVQPARKSPSTRRFASRPVQTAPTTATCSRCPPTLKPSLTAPRQGRGNGVFAVTARTAGADSRLMRAGGDQKASREAVRNGSICAAEGRWPLGSALFDWIAETVETSGASAGRHVSSVPGTGPSKGASAVRCRCPRCVEGLRR